MRSIAVANPSAAAGRVREWWKKHQEQIAERFDDVAVQFTAAPGDATRITREAIANGVEHIIAIGGDGTINEVVNGFFSKEGVINRDARLCLFPVGTGGDFARSLGLSGKKLRTLLEVMETRPIDVGRAEITAPDTTVQTRRFINISSFGSSGLVVDKVNRASKRLGGKVSFYVGTIKALLQYRNQLIRLKVDDVFDEEVTINTVAVANGRYFGGSMKIAPAALVDDGLFDVVVIGDIGFGTFASKSGGLYRGEHLKYDWAQSFRGKRVEAVPLGNDDVLVDLDGEQPGRLPVRYEIEPAALNLMGPWKEAEAAASR